MTSKSLKKRSRLITRLRIIFYFIIVLLGLLIASGDLFFRSQRSADLAVYLLTSKMNELVAGNFSMAGASGNLLDGLTLHDIVISTPQRIWLKIPEVYLRYDPLSLFIGLFHFKEVTIKNLELYVAQGGKGKGLSLPFLASGGNDVLTSPLKGIGTVEYFYLEECALYEVNSTDNVLTGRAVTSINLEGRSGFALPVPVAWSAWYNVDWGYFVCEPSGLPVDFRVRKGGFSSRKFQMNDFELSVGKSSIIFDLEYPWPEKEEKKLEWRSSQIALHEFLGGEEITFATSGTLSNRPFPRAPEEKGLEILENPRLMSDTFYLKQKIAWGNGGIDILGMLGNPLQPAERVFTGAISFHHLDRRELLQAAAPFRAAGLAGYDFSRISSQLDRASFSDQLDGSLFLDLKKGAAGLDPLQINGAIQLEAFSFFGAKIRQAKANFAFNDHSFHVEHGTIVADPGTVHFGADHERFGNDSSAGKWTVNAEFDHLDLKQLSGMAKLPASLSGSGEFDLSPERLEGQLRLAPFKYGPLSFSGFSSDFFRDRAGVTIRRLDTVLQLPLGVPDKESASLPPPPGAAAASSQAPQNGLRRPIPLKLSGVIGNEGDMNLMLAVPGLEAAVFAPGLAGEIEALVSISGVYPQPDVSVDFLGQAIEGSGFSAARLAGRIKIVNLPESPAAVYELHGDTIEAGSVSLSSFHVSAHEDESYLCGLLSLSGKKTEPSCTLYVQDLALHDGVQEWNLEQPTVLRIAKEAVEVDPFTFKTGRSSIGGHLKYAGQGEVDGQFRVQEYRIPAVILKQIPMPLPPGDLTLDLKAHGSAQRPDLGISLTFQPDQVDHTEAIIEKKTPAKAAEGMAKSLGPVQLQGQLVAGRMHLAGSVTLLGDRAEIGLQMPLVFSLSPFAFSPEYKAMTGSMSLQKSRLAGLNIMGRRDYPGSFALDMKIIPHAEADSAWLSGEVRLQDTAFKLPHTDVKFTGGQGDFSYGNGKLLLQDFFLKSERGNIVMTGAVALGPLGDIGHFDFLFDSEQLDLVYVGPHRGIIAGRVEVKGTLDEPFIYGNLTLLEAMIQRPPISVSLEHTEDVVVYTSRADVAGERAPGYFPDFATLLGSTGFDLTLEVPGNLIFDAGDLKLELYGRLRLQNDADEGFRLKGNLTAMNSVYQVAGKTFNVSLGELVFDEDDRIDPRLTATAVYSNPDITITAQVNGTVNIPVVRLESEPWLSKEDIRTFILFGRSRERLQEEDAGGFQGGLAAFLGGAIIERFKGSRDKPGLFESLNFSSTESEAGESNLSVGKYLSDDFLLSYEYQLNTASSGQLHLEYKLKGGFSIESLMMDSEKSGLDLFWKRDF